MMDLQTGRFYVEAERGVAIASADHQAPWGTRLDNSRNLRFNAKLNRLFHGHSLRILDLGCAGGGFVEDCVDQGHRAIGLEGSDYSKKMGRAAWRSIPEALFTCDISRPFKVVAGDRDNPTEPVLFDVVTCWEVLEHLAEADLVTVCDNVRRHLKETGLWIVSISPSSDVCHGIELHQTVHPKPWWVAFFQKNGFVALAPHCRYFNTQFVRGPKQGARGSFHLVLSTHPASAPPIPAERLGQRLQDRWIGCRLQRLLQRVVVGA